MKKMITMSLVAAATTVAFASTADDIANLQSQIDSLKAKQGKINAQSANDNIKWGVDFRTAWDNINYDLADGTSAGNNDLFSMRLWLNMAYAADEHNIFKGQLSMNKAFGADFATFMPNGQSRAFSLGGMFDWTGNEALTDNTLHVRQAYWLYLGDNAFGADIPWTFSIGRRPSTNGFLANLSQDDAAQSPLAHVINVEFDGLSSKLDLSNVTGVPGMTFKLCVGRGSTNATPLFGGPTSYATTDNDLDNIDLAGFIFEPYNDGQYIVKATWYRAFDLPDMVNAMDPSQGFKQVGDMDGAALSVLIDGLTDDGYASDVKLFGSFAWTKSNPDAGEQMFGTTQPNAFAAVDPSQPALVTFGSPADESQTGTSYWFGAYLPVSDGTGESYGTVGLEYNHGSQYWRPFTYAEDTMIGSKIAARGDAWEVNYTYQINDALSLQARYVSIDYDYTGSNGFFGDATGVAMSIDDVKANAEQSTAFVNGPVTFDPTDPNWRPSTLADLRMIQDAPMPGAPTTAQVDAIENQAYQAIGMASQIVEKAQDFRLYLRYRF